jgi:hypothetical protein
VRLRVGGQPVALRVSGSSVAFGTGAPLHAVSCGAGPALPAGAQRLSSEPGPFAVDQLLLQSPAPHPLASIASVSGTVTSSGTAGRGSYDHVRLSVSRASWLVLGEGYNRGWRAWCDGRSLGPPAPIDGYANGWRVGPGCSDARFAFAPNTLAAVGYGASAAIGLACLVLLLVGARLGRRRSTGAASLAPGEWGTVTPERPRPAWHALALSLPAGAVFGFAFGLAAGLASVPVIAVVLWRGIGAGRMTLAAGALLGVVVPILYLVGPGERHGGNHYAFASQHMAAHWVGVAAIGLLIGALWRALTARRPRPAQP